jgi:hypothetical protein
MNTFFITPLRVVDDKRRTACPLTTHPQLICTRVIDASSFDKCTTLALAARNEDLR